MYYLSPRNSYVLVENMAEAATVQRSFVLPTTYKEDTLHHKIMRVVESSSGKYESESLVLIPTNGIEEIEINKHKYYLVSENYIMAVVTHLEDKV